MTNSVQDRKIFAEAMHALGETFNEPVSDIRSEAYFDALKDFELDSVNLAVRHAIRTCKFFPRPVELRELIEGDSEAGSDAAWAELLREVRRVGYLGVPVFTDSRVLPAIQALWGDWRNLCETLPGEGPELVGWIKQFKGAYRSQERRSQQAQLVVRVPKALGEALAAIAERKTL